MKRKIAVTMAMLMACSSVVPTFGAVTFKDIDDVPWQGAQTFINRAGELEIMVGEVVDGERYFRGKDNVTCFETVQLVYSMLDKTGNLKSTEGIESKWSYVMKQLSVPEWAYPCISYSLEYGIVSMSEVGKFTNASKGTPTYATREAAAVILGKAMSDKYTLDTDAKLSFSDASSTTNFVISLPFFTILKTSSTYSSLSIFTIISIASTFTSITPLQFFKASISTLPLIRITFLR